MKIALNEQLTVSFFWKHDQLEVPKWLAEKKPWFKRIKTTCIVKFNDVPEYEESVTLNSNDTYVRFEGNLATFKKIMLKIKNQFTKEERKKIWQNLADSMNRNPLNFAKLPPEEIAKKVKKSLKLETLAGEEKKIDSDLLIG